MYKVTIRKEDFEDVEGFEFGLGYREGKLWMKIDAKKEKGKTTNLFATTLTMIKGKPRRDSILLASTSEDGRLQALKDFYRDDLNEVSAIG